MSTNFYGFPPDDAVWWHLGQRAGGWRFAFRAYPDQGITDAKSWLKQLSKCDRIKDEYGTMYSADAFLEAVEACEQGQRRELHGNDWYDDEGNYFCASEFS